MRPRLNLGQRLALLREADEHPQHIAALCARHNVDPDVLAAWREEFRAANIREIHLAELRAQPDTACSPEARELLHRLAGLEALLRRRTAEIHALRQQLRAAKLPQSQVTSTSTSTSPFKRQPEDMTHA